MDCMGVVKSTEEAVEFTSKAGKLMTKREIHICDDSGRGVDATMWGDTAKLTVLKVGQILGIKSAKIASSDFKSLSLSISWDSKVEVSVCVCVRVCVARWATSFLHFFFNSKETHTHTHTPSLPLGTYHPASPGGPQ